MQKINTNVIYDTSSSLLIGSFRYKESHEDILDSLYITPDGEFFRHCQCLPQSINCKKEPPSHDQIFIPLSTEKGFEWAEHLLLPDAFELLKKMQSIL